MTNSIKSFKDLMSLIPTSVSVVACLDERQVFGCTISSLVSLDVGLDSAKILFVLKKESLIGSKIIKNKYFSINVLTNTQKKYAENRRIAYKLALLECRRSLKEEKKLIGK